MKTVLMALLIVTAQTAGHLQQKDDSLKYRVVYEKWQGSKVNVVLHVLESDRFYAGTGFGGYMFAKSTAIDQAYGKFLHNAADSVSFKSFKLNR